MNFPRLAFLSTVIALLLQSTAALLSAVSWSAPPEDQTEGQFWRLHWYERTSEELPPPPTRRLRINSPEVSLHPNFGQRPEATDNGLMLIRSDENMSHVTAAELYLELWGGHPKTTNKRFTINGQTTYQLPRDGVEEGHCSYSYPSIPLKVSDLVNGLNAIQFSLDLGKTFWGHAMIDEGCLRIALQAEHPDLVVSGLSHFEAQVTAATLSEEGGFELQLHASEELANRISHVVYQAYYFGYDENGDRSATDWHGFTQNREAAAMLGTATEPPYAIDWDTRLIPAQENVAIRALVHFEDQPELVYMTPATVDLTITKPADRSVYLVHSHDLPVPFWSRANKLKTCHLYIDVDPAQIERAELHIVTWTGGPGTVEDYFTLNGHQLPVAEGSQHIPIYSQVPISPSILKRGLNRIELLSDTDHHGIEICLPGPALMLRVAHHP